MAFSALLNGHPVYAARQVEIMTMTERDTLSRFLEEFRDMVTETGRVSATGN
jgi:hypothetical protein